MLYICRGPGGGGPGGGGYCGGGGWYCGGGGWYCDGGGGKCAGPGGGEENRVVGATKGDATSDGNCCGDKKEGGGKPGEAAPPIRSKKNKCPLVCLPFLLS